MNNETFEKVMEEQISTCKSTLFNKAVEYADDSDRLHNFKVAATLEGCSPVRSLSGMMAKHTVSIYDMCRGHDQGVYYTKELWDEKIKDSINYLLLLKALIVESKEV